MCKQLSPLPAGGIFPLELGGSEADMATCIPMVGTVFWNCGMILKPGKTFVGLNNELVYCGQPPEGCEVVVTYHKIRPPRKTRRARQRLRRTRRLQSMAVTTRIPRKQLPGRTLRRVCWMMRRMRSRNSSGSKTMVMRKVRFSASAPD